MVRIRDDGVFDAPIEKVWKYVNDNQNHQHESFQITKVLEQKGNAMTIEARVANPSGGKDMEKYIMTMNPPKGFTLEYLSGAMKGSKQTHTYTSMGNRTRVDVDGEFVGKGMDDNTIRKNVLAYYAMVFNEDNANLKKYK